MTITKYVPNFITVCNILCGCLSVYYAVYSENLLYSSLLIFGASVFDFFDGMFARLLKAYSALGKELDSLADLISFGVAPSMILVIMLKHSLNVPDINPLFTVFLPATLIPIFSALRLAKFNIDTRQTSSFIGLPTPANAFVFASLPLLLFFSTNSTILAMLHNYWILIAIIVIHSYLLVSSLPLFSLKFKNFDFKKNIFKYIFLLYCVFIFIINPVVSIPFMIYGYIIISIIENFVKKPRLHQ